MPTYINSKGDSIDTSSLADPHLQRAYDKAIREGNNDNIKALEEELNTRGQTADTTDDATTDDTDTDSTDENTP